MADDAPRYKDGIDTNPLSTGYGFAQPATAAPPLATSPDLTAPLAPFGAPTPAAAFPASREGTIQFWMQQGAPAHVAAGIADRVNAESGYKSAIMGDAGTSGGLYQHHADRLARLKTFAAQQGKPWTDPTVQHQFALSEVQGGDAIAAKNWQAILSAPDQQTAAMLWDRFFERSKYGPGSATPRAAGTTRPAAGGGGGSTAAAGLLAGMPTVTTTAPPSSLSRAMGSPVTLQLPEQAAASAPAPLARAVPAPMMLQPTPLAPAPNLYKGYQDALASILGGHRRGFGSIFG